MTKFNGSELTDFLTRPPKRIHLIGVAGSGMSGIAGLLLGIGHQVSGCDRVSSLETRRLESLGLVFHLPQTAEVVHGSDLVVFSSAIRSDNPAYQEAERLGLPLIRRAEALAALMASRDGIIIAGMHGKTTTSAMAAHVLRIGQLRPSHYVGGEIPILGTNAHWEADALFFVAEGDESDGTLRGYFPRHAIILNVEPEHLDYYEDLEAIDEVFRQLIRQTSGTIFFCADDLHATRLCGALPNAVSFGQGAASNYRFVIESTSAFGSCFRVFAQEADFGLIELGVPGQHNVSNATAVVALAHRLGVNREEIQQALASFRGARRRFEQKLRNQDFLLVDDYAHHPSEIRATLETARAIGRERILAMFQPHRFSRTQAFLEQFGSAFRAVDKVYVCDVYPAGERSIPGVSGKEVVDQIRANGQEAEYIPARRLLHRSVAREARSGDLIISLGAGDIHEEATKLVEDLETARQLREAMGSGEIRLYEPLSQHTTLRVGGPAQFWIEPATRGGLANVLGYCSVHRLPVMFIGRGSNLLVRDGGVRGVIVHLARGDFATLRVNGDEIHAGAGVRLKQIVGAARQANLGGFEWMEGIPGSVGGSLRMNAGAMGTETFEQVVNVQVVDDRGEFTTLGREDFAVEYRNVPTLRERFAVAAVFRGFPSDRATIDTILLTANSRRRKAQPVAASAGCIFKNPPNCPAGQLVEELGMKDQRQGAARVSPMHGNFIVNEGGATAHDVLKLVAQIQNRAKAERNIDLRLEVEVVGVSETGTV